jgi:hypothetical protein
MSNFKIFGGGGVPTPYQRPVQNSEFRITEGNATNWRTLYVCTLLDL